jgi:hypothetical protein
VPSGEVCGVRYLPELIPWCGEVRAVPFKRYDRPGLCYLDKPEIGALSRCLAQKTDSGSRVR